VELLRGDYDDPAGIALAARGADAVIASGTAHRAGPDGELRPGLAFADAITESGVPHLVWISGDGAERETGVPVLEAKRSVEARIAELGLPATVLAPVYFMENLLNAWNLPPLRASVLPSPVSPSRPLQQVAIADVIRFAVMAVEQREEFLGRRIRLAGDELTAELAADAIGPLAGRRPAPRRAPFEALNPGLRLLFEWPEDTGHDVPIAELRAAYPEVGWHDFPAWAAAQDWPAILVSEGRRSLPHNRKPPHSGGFP
jgi:uncharacterized protein YbjT (DUF2867 family)